MTAVYDISEKGNGLYDLSLQSTNNENAHDIVNSNMIDFSKPIFKSFGAVLITSLIQGVQANGSHYGCYKFKFTDCDDIKIEDDTFSLEGCKLECDNWGDCFSSNMTLDIVDEGQLTMDKLRPGMVAKLSDGSTFTITDLPHRDPNKTIEYLKIGFEGGFLEISPEHHLILKNKENGQIETLFAKKVVSHSEEYQVQYNGEWIDIAQVEWTKEKGVYTVEGFNVHELEVNGVRVGAYSKTNSPFIARNAMRLRQIYHKCVAMPNISDDTIRSEGTWEKKLIKGISSIVPFFFG